MNKDSCSTPWYRTYEMRYLGTCAVKFQSLLWQHLPCKADRRLSLEEIEGLDAGFVRTHGTYAHALRDWRLTRLNCDKPQPSYRRLVDLSHHQYQHHHHSILCSTRCKRKQGTMANLADDCKSSVPSFFVCLESCDIKPAIIQITPDRFRFSSSWATLLYLPTYSSIDRQSPISNLTRVSWSNFTSRVNQFKRCHPHLSGSTCERLLQDHHQLPSEIHIFNLWRRGINIRL